MNNEVDYNEEEDVTHVTGIEICRDRRREIQI